MKKSALLLLIIFISGVALAAILPETLTQSALPRTLSSSTEQFPASRTAPAWSFNIAPVDVLPSFYDYMIGGYNGQPMQVLPDANGGGYYLTFHGNRTSAGVRRVFYAYITPTGVVQSVNEITTATVAEGYPSLDLDDAIGYPFFTWHSNFDTDSQSEVLYDWNLLSGIVPGPFSPTNIAINNPVTLPAPYSTTDNTYIWPVVQTGPSPTVGMNRIYILARNNVDHSAGTSCESAYIAYADYSTTMLSNSTPLTWSYISVPDLNAWNNDATVARSPFYGFAVSDDGFIGLMGYHSGGAAPNLLDELDVDVWLCDNYGAGTWSHYSASSNIPSWNPPTNFGAGPGFFTGATDQNLVWKALDSGHINAVLDDSEQLHFFGMWQLEYMVPGNATKYNGLNCIKQISFNCNLYQFSTKEIYPKAGTSSDTLNWQPWDQDNNHVVDVYDSTNGNPVIPLDWNFSYWNSAAGNNQLGFQYNNFKMTEAGDDGWMAAVWQNSRRAYRFHVLNDTSMADYTNAPEIFISLSSDYGQNWSDPIIINAVDVAEFAGNTPMWVYPANRVKDMGIINGHPMGRLGLMFYNDSSWGSYAVGTTGSNTGGTVKFMEIDVDMSTLVPTRIAGTVRNSFTQIPLPGVTVSNGLNTVFTDDLGNFTIPCAPGVYTVSITEPGYQTCASSVVTVLPGQTTLLHSDLVRIITISGQIYSVNPSAPLNGATATFVGTETYSGNTNSQGTYTIPNVVAHQIYEFTLSKLGFTSFTGSVEILDDDINMGIYTIQGTPNEDEEAIVYINGFSGAYPNPFKTSTRLDFTLKNPAPVELSIYNLLGQKVAHLNRAANPKGPNSLIWDGKDSKGHNLSSGVYFCRLQSGNFSETRKLMLLK